MRKLLLMIIAVAAFVACNDKNDDGPKVPGATGSGSVNYNNLNHPIFFGWMDYYGEKYEDNKTKGTVSLTLVLTTEGVDLGIEFEMHVKNTNNKLVAGVYMLDAGCGEFTFSNGAVILGEGEGEYYIPVTAGTVTIDISGNVYTITINCVAAERPVTGTYTGSLLWEDWVPPTTK